MRSASAVLLLLSLSLWAGGCTTANPESPYSLVGPDGVHPAGWIGGHGSVAGTDGAPCIPCHGADLSGGIAAISCRASSVGGQLCHPMGPAFHPSTWLDKGFLHTGGYHATAYSLGALVAGHPCAVCHTPPPLDGTGGFCRTCHFDITGRRTPLSGSTYSHGAISGHAVFATPQKQVCIACHEIDQRFGHPPNCHNCHAPFPTAHPATWLNKGLRHTSGYHATAYSLGLGVAGLSCADCHTPPPLDGTDGFCRTCHFDITGRRTPLSGSTYSHGAITGHTVFTSPQNDVCIACHQIDQGFGFPPACHNCHAPFPSFHPAGWAAASQHGAVAKAPPSSSGGFSWCQACHGSNFAGGTSGVTCLSTTTCHASNPGRPHPGPLYWGGHTSTSTGNAAACALCHRTALGTAGCFNNTLCHGSAN